mmetsp:Transcript_7674/g.22924  ORF Transcript_7674/g.22924 Transcript_7674/m.22924 type:complete len:332 (+) Transcript_7674:236-1231(+)
MGPIPPIIPVYPIPRPRLRPLLPECCSRLLLPPLPPRCLRPPIGSSSSPAPIPHLALLRSLASRFSSLKSLFLPSRSLFRCLTSPARSIESSRSKRRFRSSRPCNALSLPNTPHPSKGTSRRTPAVPSPPRRLASLSSKTPSLESRSLSPATSPTSSSNTSTPVPYSSSSLRFPPPIRFASRTWPHHPTRSVSPSLKAPRNSSTSRERTPPGVSSLAFQTVVLETSSWRDPSSPRTSSRLPTVRTRAYRTPPIARFSSPVGSRSTFSSRTNLENPCGRRATKTRPKVPCLCSLPSRPSSSSSSIPTRWCSDACPGTTPAPFVSAWLLTPLR